MHLQLESNDPYTVQAYGENEVKINEIIYRSNLIVSAQGIVPDWSIQSLALINSEDLQSLLRYNPEIIIIGHNKSTTPPFSITQQLIQQRIGMEWMSIGAACRTYNVLLSEMRSVVLGLIFA